jgi:hypothetical protein
VHGALTISAPSPATGRSPRVTRNGRLARRPSVEQSLAGRFRLDRRQGGWGRLASLRAVPAGVLGLPGAARHGPPRT